MSGKKRVDVTRNRGWAGGLGKVQPYLPNPKAGSVLSCVSGWSLKRESTGHGGKGHL